jgi:ERCC4-type nuclease
MGAPLVIDHSSGAIRLLQRIRDEAHRFANGYHQILMKQRVSESLLDDCPGVSENRKKLLLRHFGSIDKLRNATAEEIAAIDGVGPKLAENIVEFFAKLKRRPQIEDETVGEIPVEDEATQERGEDVAGPVEKEPGVVEYQLKPGPAST